MNAVKKNNLSFYNDNGVISLSAKQYDTGRKFIFKIVDNDEPFNLTGYNVYLRIFKADKTQFEGKGCCIIENNNIIVDTSLGNGDQILASSGRNICELHLVDSQGKSLTTWNFVIDVEPRVHNGDNIINSIDSWDELDHLRETVKYTKETADDFNKKLEEKYFILTLDKDVAGGVPSLDENVKVPIAELYEATTSSKGITQLTDSISSNSTTTAATPNSVKVVNDELEKEINRAKNAESDLYLKKANVESATLTGIPNAPTAPAGTDTTQIATTAFVQSAINEQAPIFTVSANRENITSGEKITNILGKIAKWFTDLKTVAFTGSYNDLKDKPNLENVESLPVAGGNMKGTLHTRDVYVGGFINNNGSMLPDTDSNNKSSLRVNGTTDLNGEVKINGTIQADYQNMNVGSIDTSGVLHMNGNNINDVGALNAMGEVSVGGRLTALNTFDMSGNDIENVKSATFNGTLRSYGELKSHNINPEQDNKYNLGKTNGYYKNGYIRNIYTDNINGKNIDALGSNADTLDGKHASDFLPITGGTITGNLRLKGSGNYGNKLNFGDSEYVFLHEYEDDKLEIKASTLKFTSNNNIIVNQPIAGSITGNAATATNADTVDGKHASDFLLTSGGTITGNLTVNGQVHSGGTSTMWKNGRDGALLRTTSMGSNQYIPLASIKTNDGSWDMGGYNGNVLWFSYITDVDYNAGTNKQTASINITPDGVIHGTATYAQSAGQATKATQDENGNNIANTYAKKTDISALTSAMCLIGKQTIDTYSASATLVFVEATINKNQDYIVSGVGCSSTASNTGNWDSWFVTYVSSNCDTNKFKKMVMVSSGSARYSIQENDFPLKVVVNKGSWVEIAVYALPRK